MVKVEYVEDAINIREMAIPEDKKQVIAKMHEAEGKTFPTTRAAFEFCTKLIGECLGMEEGCVIFHTIKEHGKLVLRLKLYSDPFYFKNLCVIRLEEEQRC